MAHVSAAVPALCRLQRLTRLLMPRSLPFGDYDEPPPSGLANLIASLPRLQQLDWHCWNDGMPLPTGPALTSLRRLRVPVPVLARSLPALSQATQLEALELSPRSADAGDDSTALCAVLRWAPQQPTLRLVSLDLGQADSVTAQVLNAALAAQRVRPELHIATDLDVFQYKTAR